MFKEILIWLAIATGIGGTLWYQHHEIKVRDTQLLMLQSQVNGLTEARKQDAKTVNDYAAKVSKAQKQNAEFSRQLMDAQHEKSNADFLALPIPDGLRDIINQYIGASPGTDGKASMPAADPASNSR